MAFCLAFPGVRYRFCIDDDETGALKEKHVSRKGERQDKASRQQKLGCTYTPNKTEEAIAYIAS